MAADVRRTPCWFTSKAPSSFPLTTVKKKGGPLCEESLSLTTSCSTLKPTGLFSCRVQEAKHTRLSTKPNLHSKRHRQVFNNVNEVCTKQSFAVFHWTVEKEEVVGVGEQWWGGERGEGESWGLGKGTCKRRCTGSGSARGMACGRRKREEVIRFSDATQTQDSRKADEGLSQWDRLKKQSTKRREKSLAVSWKCSSLSIDGLSLLFPFF